MRKTLLVLALSAAALFAGRPAHVDGTAPVRAVPAGPVWISSENPFGETPWWNSAAKKPEQGTTAGKQGKPDAAGGEKPAAGGHPGGGYGRPTGSKVWLMYEDASGEAKCLPGASGTFAAYGNELETVEAKAVSMRGCTSVTIDTVNPGRYLLYYTADRVIDGVRRTLVAKHEKNYVRHGDRGELGRGEPDDVPFDIVRIKAADEEAFFRYQSGDTVAFRILSGGKPVKGAVVKLATGGGWSKRLKSDAEGKVAFQLIRDYFPDWKEFDKRYKERFVVTATWSRDEVGKLGKTPYRRWERTLTYADFFYPENAGYQSYAYALAFGTAAMVLTGVVIYWYRRRRMRPFEEVIFDEKA